MTFKSCNRRLNIAGYELYQKTKHVDVSNDVDCVPGGWGEWGDCSADCGGGTQTRNLDSFTPLVGSGNDCVHSETRDCNMDACDADCVPGGWGDWGECSADCGGGTQTRNLASFTPLVGSGNDCVHSETRDCNMDSCGPQKFQSMAELLEWCADSEDRCEKTCKQHWIIFMRGGSPTYSCQGNYFGKTKRCKNYKGLDVCSQLPGCKVKTKVQRNGKTKKRCKGRVNFKKA